MKGIHKLFEDTPPGESESFHWRAAVEKAIASNDLQSLKEAAIIAAQIQMIQLAMDESESGGVRYNAAAFLLSQSGHGPVSKIEQTLEYKRMPPDQLIPIIQARLAKIMKSNPDFDVQKLIPVAKNQSLEEDLPNPPILDAEFSTYDRIEDEEDPE